MLNDMVIVLAFIIRPNGNNAQVHEQRRKFARMIKSHRRIFAKSQIHEDQSFVTRHEYGLFNIVQSIQHEISHRRKVTTQKKEEEKESMKVMIPFDHPPIKRIPFSLSFHEPMW